jgi:hypothetical protein
MAVIMPNSRAFVQPPFGMSARRQRLRGSLRYRRNGHKTAAATARTTILSQAARSRRFLARTSSSSRKTDTGSADPRQDQNVGSTPLTNPISTAGMGRGHSS